MRGLKLVIAFIIILMGQVAFAQSATDLYKKANEMRERGYLAEALSLYNQVKSLDAEYAPDCDYWIERIKRTRPKSNLKVSATSLGVKYQGGKYEVVVTGGDGWNAVCDADWIKLEREGDKLVIDCEENTSTEPRLSEVEVRFGDFVEKISVLNDGAPESLNVSSNIVNFSEKAGEEYITVESNVNWIISTKPSWCLIEIQRDRLHISVSENNTLETRSGIIRIASSGLSTDISVSQTESQPELQLSKNTLYFSMHGGVDTVKVYSGNHMWKISDFPYWCNATRISDSTLVVSCSMNDLIETKREGGLKIHVGDQYELIKIYQELAPKPEYVPIQKIVEGKNIAFGILAGYNLPFIDAKSSSKFTASAINYSLGDNREQCDYKSTGGFIFGGYVDIRLFRNLFLNAGVNYSQYTYTNKFDEKYERRINWHGVLIKGETDNQYEETYDFNLLEVPLRISYRFPIDNVSFLAINCGPVLSFGLNSTMSLSGNTFSPRMDCEEKVGGYKNWAYTLEGYFDMYDNKGVYTEYYTGSDVSTLGATFNPWMSAAPYKKNTVAGALGLMYEFRCLGVELEYYHMFSNMANDKFWNSERIEIFTFGSDVLMSGYRQRNHKLQIKLSYTFRYKSL